MALLNIVALLIAAILGNIILGIYVIINIYMLMEYGKLYNQKTRNMQ